jgi:hypothetical protein
MVIVYYIYILQNDKYQMSRVWMKEILMKEVPERKKWLQELVEFCCYYDV